MYMDDKENVIFEDIYDGNKLIRKNNREGTARVYDLIKYSEFKRQHSDQNNFNLIVLITYNNCHRDYFSLMIKAKNRYFIQIL